MVSFLDVSTEIGGFEIQLLDNRAPATCAYFRELAMRGAFRDGSIFRVVSRKKHIKHGETPIDVVQVGTALGLDEARRIITHEHSGVSGIRHGRGVVSAARFAPGELYGSFFICLEAEPALDFGGERHLDSAGFAAFGVVTAGLNVIVSAHDRAEDRPCLESRIPVMDVAYRTGSGPAGASGVRSGSDLTP
ncbi:MAG: peptidylprolyl isomerase, partial [Chromatocurvus sp.]